MKVEDCFIWFNPFFFFFLARGARCAGPRGAGRMHRAAGSTDGWLLARRRGLDRGGDSCLGPLGGLILIIILQRRLYLYFRDEENEAQ